MIAVKKIQKAIYLLFIFFPGNIALTGGIALLDMVIQAGALLSYIFGKTSAAGPEMIQFSGKFYNIFYSSSAGKRAKISGFILLHLSGHHDPWKFFSHCHFYERIVFVILQHSIIFRSVLFDQIGFQNQSFKLRICDNILKSGNLLYHLLFLDPQISAFLEVLTYPVF